ncbi:hypothetical protein LP420_28605 [Massilia sp. B-10]|nr:hypothetical protein LP420_28605 [Massilia sp. B-10]
MPIEIQIEKLHGKNLPTADVLAKARLRARAGRPPAQSLHPPGRVGRVGQPLHDDGLQE